MKKFAVILLMAFAFSQSTSYASDYDIYESRPSFSPYYAGVVKREVLQETLDELNEIRRLIGVPDNVALDDDYTNKAQHGAVLLDVIGHLDHTPGKPAGMSDEFYELGYAGTSHSNIAFGTALTLKRSIALYMDDSDSGNIARLGHRRWLMNPKMTHTGFGMSVRGGFSATYVFQRQAEQKQWPIPDEFISWPVSKNPHPLNYFSESTAWSVILNGNIFVSFNDTGINDVAVKLSCLDDGREWNFSESKSDGYFNIETSGYGDGECIIFRPDDIDGYNDGGKWRAEISGLVRISGDVSSDILSFDVTFAKTTQDDNNTNQNNNTDTRQDNNNTNQDNNTEQNNNNNNNTNQDNNNNTRQIVYREDNTTRQDNNNTRQETTYRENIPEHETPPSQNNGGSSGGGCNTMPLFILALMLGIPRMKK